LQWWLTAFYLALLVIMQNCKLARAICIPDYEYFTDAKSRGFTFRFRLGKFGLSGDGFIWQSCIIVG